MMNPPVTTLYSCHTHTLLLALLLLCVSYVKIGKRIDGRKRNLAQSLVMVMNTQDVTPGFHALPSLAPTAEGFALAQRRRAAAGIEVSSEGKALLNNGQEGAVAGHMGRNASALGGAPAESKLDEQGVALAIEEFNLRIKNLDTMKRKMGEVSELVRASQPGSQPVSQNSQPTNQNHLQKPNLK
jgi:hypothetical protein